MIIQINTTSALMIYSKNINCSRIFEITNKSVLQLTSFSNPQYCVEEN